jgi:hypothetical protein
VEDPVITSEDLGARADERQAALRQEAAVARLVRRAGARRPIRIVRPAPSRLALTAASLFARAGTLRVEH